MIMTGISMTGFLLTLLDNTHLSGLQEISISRRSMQSLTRKPYTLYSGWPILSFGIALNWVDFMWFHCGGPSS